MAKIDLRRLTNRIKEKYQIADNTFSYNPKDIVNDRCEVEIGDIKTPDSFLPQVKIKRWNNEVNFSLRLNAEGSEAESVNFNGEKIEWAKGDIKVHLYDKPELTEDGGYEFEIILNKKPKSNLIVSTIETKGLEFLEQKAMNLEPLDGGFSADETHIFDRDGKVLRTRPENVVDSIAAYYKDCPLIHAGGGNLYRAGKVFHIYRIKATDVNGNWVWGKQKIDVEKKQHIIELPQEFLDKAAYPVVVDPSLGYTTIGATSGIFTADTIRTNKYTPSEAAKVLGFYVYGAVSSDGQTAKYRPVIYKSSDLSLITHGGEIASTSATEAWLSGSVTEATLQASTEYRLGVWLGVTSGYYPTLRYDSGLTLYRDNGQTYHSTNTPVNPLVDDASAANYKISIFFLYAPTTGTGVDIFNSKGTYTWICPAGVTSVDVECWGGGGGGTVGASGHGGDGGGGGAYAKKTAISVTPGNSYTIVVGNGGASAGNGGDSSWQTTVVVAKGGLAGSTGGQASASTGDTKYNGGNGGGDANYDCGGGGGGAGGPDGNGNNGSNATSDSGGGGGGSGDAGSGGAGGTSGNPGTANVKGGGGAGGDVNGNAKVGGLPGGGGAGSYGTYNGGLGADGQVKITYSTVTVPTVTTQAVDSIGSGGGTGNGNITATGGENCTKRGFVYATASKSAPGNVAPASSGYDGYVEDTGSYGTGAFTKAITGLNDGQTYYVRAYAYNSAGYAYGDEVNFKTDDLVEITKTSAYLVLAAAEITKGALYNVLVAGEATKTAEYRAKPVSEITRDAVYAVISGQEIAKSTQYTVTAPDQEMTKGAAYAITKTAEITIGLQYAVIPASEATKGAAYAVITTHETTKGLVYAAAPVTDIAKGAQYTVQTGVAITKDAAYSVIPASEIAKGAIYTVITLNHEITIGLAYYLALPTETTKAAGYAIVKTAEATKGAEYCVLPAGEITRSAAYLVIAPVEATKGLDYEVIAPVEITKGLAYAIQTSAEITKECDYIIRGMIEVAKDLAYCVQADSETTKGAGYSIIKSGQVDVGLAYATIPASELAKGATYRVWTASEATKGLDYELGTVQEIYKGAQYAVQANVEFTKSLVYFVAAEVEVQKGLKYEIVAPQELTKGADYCVQAAFEIVKNTGYTIATSAEISKSAAYVIDLGADITKTAEYKVFAAVDITKLAEYRVPITVEKTMKLKYSINRSGVMSNSEFKKFITLNKVMKNSYRSGDFRFERR